MYYIYYVLYNYHRSITRHSKKFNYFLGTATFSKDCFIKNK